MLRNIEIISSEFDWAPVNFVRFLSAGDVTAEMAFPEPQNRICTNPWNNDTGSEDSSDDNSFHFSADNEGGSSDEEAEDSDPEDEPGTNS